MSTYVLVGFFTVEVEIDDEELTIDEIDDILSDKEEELKTTSRVNLEFDTWYEKR